LSFAIDVNVLLYASDSGSELHSAAARFLASCASGKEAFYLPWPVVMGYLRVATHPAILAHPLSAEEASSNVGALMDLPHCRPIAEEPGFWDVYQRVVADSPSRGNLVPDAHVAALLLQHGIRRVYTRDRDYRRFPFLEVLDPFAKRGR
jgi:hypothetical protein